jgi:sugar/nucleoside kinase (ribokinase family)
MYDLSLYGHITLDNINDKDSYNSSIGSIGNLWFNLKSSYPKLRINLQPTEFGKADIFIDRDKSERKSKADLSLYTIKPKIFPSKWNHVLYLNQLKDLDFIDTINSGILSADFCAGQKIKDNEILKKFNFIFISDEDLFMDLSEMSRLVKNGVIMHHTEGSEYYENGIKKFEKKVKKINNVNVLGCGDMFASFFMASYLLGSNVEESIEISHKKITTHLQTIIHDNRS